MMACTGASEPDNQLRAALHSSKTQQRAASGANAAAHPPGMLAHPAADEDPASAEHKCLRSLRPHHPPLECCPRVHLLL